MEKTNYLDLFGDFEVGGDPLADFRVDSLFGDFLLLGFTGLGLDWKSLSKTASVSSRDALSSSSSPLKGARIRIPVPQMPKFGSR